METKRKLINVFLITTLVAFIALMIYYLNKEEKALSKLYSVKIHGTISDIRYTNKVDYLNDGTISFIDYETNRRYHVATQFIVIGPKIK